MIVCYILFLQIKCSLDKNTSDLTNMIVKESSPAIKTALQEYIALLRDGKCNL